MLAKTLFLSAWRRPYPVAALLAVTYFFFLAGPGLMAYFSPDDMLNLDGVWIMDMRDLIMSNLRIATPDYRPLGGLAYRVLYDLAGYNPFYFRLFCFTLLISNLYLVYSITRFLRSRFAGAIAALVTAYHGGMADLYYSSGTLYDLLCVFFYFLALLVYLHARNAKDTRKQSALALVVVILYACALNSKEMAVTFPACVVMYEFLLCRDLLKLPHWRNLLQPRIIAIGGMIILTCFYILAKTGPESVFSRVGAYQSTYSLNQLFLSWGSYLGQVTYRAEPVGMIAVTATIVLSVVVFALVPVPLVRFSIPWAIVAALPVSFVPPRGLFVWYLPFLILSMAAGTLVDVAGEALARNPAIARILTRRGVRLSVYGVVFTLLLTVHFEHRNQVDYWIRRHESDLKELIASVARRWPHSPPATSILLLNDNFPPDNFTAYFALRLYYKDPDLNVLRAKMLPTGQKPDLSAFGLILDYRDGHYVEAAPRTSR